MLAHAAFAVLVAAAATLDGTAARPVLLEPSAELLPQPRALRTVSLGDWLEQNGSGEGPQAGEPAEALAATEEARPPRRARDDAAGGGTTACSDKALEFIDLLNEYRAEKGEPPIPASDSMCIVSAAHVKDLELHSPDGTGDDHCGMHSWSDEGPWTDCCFPDTRFSSDPSEAVKRCSWDKPREITGYPDNGYENTLFNPDSEEEATPRTALENWKLSEAHHDLMINGGSWQDNTFKAVGAGFYGKYAVMWVGEIVDERGGAGDS